MTKRISNLLELYFMETNDLTEEEIKEVERYLEEGDEEDE